MAAEPTIPKNLVEAIRGGTESIAKRKEEVLKQFREANKKTNTGLNADAAIKALEYAILTIADGTIKSANALAKALGVSNDKQLKDIYKKAVDNYESKFDTKDSTLNRIKTKLDGGVSKEVTVSEKELLYEQIEATDRAIKEGIAQQKVTEKERNANKK